jgi:hypothetical protein
MGGYRYYMGHLINGACGGVVAMMGAASYAKYISAAADGKRAAMMGLGAPQEPDTDEEMKEPVPNVIDTQPVPNVIDTRSRESSGSRTISPRPPAIQTRASQLVSADTPTMQINTATLPPEDRELKRDVTLILKWKAADYDTPAGRKEIKQHFDNI